ncbi:MAG TPA: hypothetical protein VFR29_09520 [Steroidobacteraceae bacterium]|nr:hypothetical protein [Steroidobacteraceae bacterium]
MFSKLFYRGLPVPLLIVSAAVMQGFAVHAFAQEAVQAEVVAGVEPERQDCRPVERLGGKVKIRKAECRGQP